MKKFLSILILMAVVLSCCACGAQEATQPTFSTQEPTQAETQPVVQQPANPADMTPEQVFGNPQSEKTKAFLRGTESFKGEWVWIRKTRKSRNYSV